MNKEQVNEPVISAPLDVYYLAQRILRIVPKVVLGAGSWWCIKDGGPGAIPKEGTKKKKKKMGRSGSHFEEGVVTDAH